MRSKRSRRDYFLGFHIGLACCTHILLSFALYPTCVHPNYHAMPMELGAFYPGRVMLSSLVPQTGSLVWLGRISKREALTIERML
jgi:hypothetical protein